MKNRIGYALALLSALIFLNSCSAIETIFKAGMWWAFFLVGLVVVIVLYIVYKVKKK